MRNYLLDRIVKFILLNRSSIDNIGLLNGKMGISIFFYHYSRYTRRKIFKDYADELINEIFDMISINTPPYFTDGLTGIGWGIEYLVKNNFIKYDTDEALTKIDIAIYRHMLNSPVLLNTGDDLFGYGFYHIARLNGHKNNDGGRNILLKKQNLKFLTDACERLLIHKKYLDFDKLYLCTGTINSLLWFLLEMFKLELLPVKIRKLLQYLPECIGPSQKEKEMPTESYLLQSLAKSTIETIPDEKIESIYQSVIDTYNSDLRIVPDGHSFVNTMAYLCIQNLIYQPYTSIDHLIQELFEKAFNIIDNEEDWNRKLDHTYKFRLGLSGLAGLGLYILIEVNSSGSTKSDFSLKHNKDD